MSPPICGHAVFANAAPIPLQGCGRHRGPRTSRVFSVPGPAYQAPRRRPDRHLGPGPAPPGTCVLSASGPGCTWPRALDHACGRRRGPCSGPNQARGLGIHACACAHSYATADAHICALASRLVSQQGRVTTCAYQQPSLSLAICMHLCSLGACGDALFQSTRHICSICMSPHLP